jgi:hypothetical protein
MNMFDAKPAILAKHSPHVKEVNRFTRAVAAQGFFRTVYQTLI